MEVVAPTGEQRAAVTVAVQPSRGRLVELRRPKAARATRRLRALGRVHKIRRPHVKTERRVQRKTPKVREVLAARTASDALAHTSRNCAHSMRACRTETSPLRRW